MGNNNLAIKVKAILDPSTSTLENDVLDIAQKINKAGGLKVDVSIGNIADIQKLIKAAMGAGTINLPVASIIDYAALRDAMAKAQAAASNNPIKSKVVFDVDDQGNQKVVKQLNTIKDAAGDVTKEFITLDKKTNRLRISKVEVDRDFEKPVKDAVKQVTELEKQWRQIEKLKSEIATLDPDVYGGLGGHIANKTSDLKELQKEYGKALGTLIANPLADAMTGDKAVVEGINNLTKQRTQTVEALRSAEVKRSQEFVANSKREEQALRQKVGVSQTLNGSTLHFNDDSSIEDQIRQMKNFGNAIISATEQKTIQGQTFQSYTVKVKQANGQIETFIVNQNKADNSVRILEKGLSSVSNGFAGLAKRIAGMMGLSMLMYAPIRATRDSIRVLREVDTALTELSKVTNIAREDFQQLGIEALETASRFGRSAQDLLQSQLQFARAGFSETYQQLAEVSLLAQAAGQLTADLASKYLIATDAAFGLGGNIEELTRILDGQNMVSNRSATSMQDMAQATQQFANTANVAGESVETMTAMINAAVGSTQRSGAEVGRALRTLSMRIRQIFKTSLYVQQCA